jgi:hypothetical protein
MIRPPLSPERRRQCLNALRWWERELARWQRTVVEDTEPEEVDEVTARRNEARGRIRAMVEKLEVDGD